MKLHQKKLLKLLSMNCRFKNKDLAKSLRVSEDTINYTKTEFLKNNVFNYSIFFDYRKLGYNSYHLMFSLKDIDDVDFEALKKIDDVIYINTFVGKFDIQIIILAKDNLNEKIDEIILVLNNNILDKLILKYEEELKLTHILPDFNVDVNIPQNQKNLIYNLKDPVILIENYEIGYNLDKKDLMIIKSLLENPTKTYLDIQKETGISRDTIRKKIKKYIEDKFLLSFSIFPNLKYFNYNTYCLLLNLDNIDKEKLRKFVFQKDYVFYVEIISNKKNLFFYIWTKNPSELSSIFKEIKTYFKEELIDLDFLFYDDYIYQKEFPTSLL